MGSLVTVQEMVIAIFGAMFASTGFWALITKLMSNRSATHSLLLGLAHDRIVWLGMQYIERGWITKDEYDDFVRYLYGPYAKFGGNGLADKVMTDVKKLRMVRKPPPGWKPESPYDKHSNKEDSDADGSGSET